MFFLQTTDWKLENLHLKQTLCTVWVHDLSLLCLARTSWVKGSHRSEAASEPRSLCPSSACRSFTEEFPLHRKGVTSLLVISWYWLPHAPLVPSGSVGMSLQNSGPGPCSLLLLRPFSGSPAASEQHLPVAKRQLLRKVWNPDYLTVLLSSAQAFSPFRTEFESTSGGPCKSTFTSCFHQERRALLRGFSHGPPDVARLLFKAGLYFSSLESSLQSLMSFSINGITMLISNKRRLCHPHLLSAAPFPQLPVSGRFFY